MNIKDKLQKVVSIYATSRGVGHTLAQLNGVKNTPNALLVVHNGRREHSDRAQARSLFGNFNGLRVPVVIEHHLVHLLCAESLQTIEALEAENAELKLKLSTIYNIVTDRN